MPKSLSASDNEACNSCHKLIVGEGFRCTECTKLSHLSCTGFPSYALACMLVTVRTYMCPACVATKKSNTINYEDALKKIELLLSSEATAAGLAESTRAGDRTENHGNLDTDDVTSILAGTPGTLAELEVSVAGGGGDGHAPASERDGPCPSQSRPDPLPTQNVSSFAERSSPPDSERIKPVCRHYLIKKCKYGRKGEGCAYPHPTLCRAYLKLGSRRKGGCSKKNCKFFHPPLCWNASKGLMCSRKNCKFMHPSGIKLVDEQGGAEAQTTSTRRVNEIPTNMQKNSQRRILPVAGPSRPTEHQRLQNIECENGDFLEMQAQIWKIQQQLEILTRPKNVASRVGGQVACHCQAQDRPRIAQY